MFKPFGKNNYFFVGGKKKRVHLPHHSPTVTITGPIHEVNLQKKLENGALHEPMTNSLKARFSRRSSRILRSRGN